MSPDEERRPVDDEAANSDQAASEIDSDGIAAVVVLTSDEARDLTDRIKATVEHLWDLIVQAYRSGAWTVLGYSSWAEYCRAEFDTDHIKVPRSERPAVMGLMSSAGMSQREISSATGVSQDTVSRAIGDRNRSDVDLVENVIQLRPGQPPAPKPAQPSASTSGPKKKDRELTPEERKRRDLQQALVLQLLRIAAARLDDVFKLPQGKFWTTEQRAEVASRVGDLDGLILRLGDRFPYDDADGDPES